MRAIDTNVLVRLIARDDAAQTRRAERFVADGAWVSTLVLAECLWVLESVYARSREQLATAVSMLLEHQQLVLQDRDAVGAALAQFQAHSGVGLTDCLVVAVAERHGHTPVGTFDKRLARLDAAQLP